MGTNEVGPRTADVIAANRYRDSLIERADAMPNGSPMWHGWVIVEAYLEGLYAGRKESEESR